MDQEAVLKAPPDAVDVAEVVDACPLRVDPRTQRLDHAVAQQPCLAQRQAAGGTQRMDPGSEQGLVGVDVADARNPALVEQHRLDRRSAPPQLLAQMLRRELLGEGLEAESRIQELLQSRRTEQERSPSRRRRAPASWHEPTLRTRPSARLAHRAAA
jgi:hypothetical protein